MPNCKFDRMIECTNCKSRNIKKIDIYEYHDIFECQDCGVFTFKKQDECCRNPNKIYVFDYYNHIPKFIRLQCKNCGGCLTMTDSFPFDKYSELVTGEFSKDRFNEWKKAKQSDGNSINEISRYIRFSKTTFYRYSIHLQSKHWRILTRQTLDRDSWTCQFCKKAKATEVHHLTYKNLGNESLDELISCCKACHESIHDKSTVPQKNS